jgi:DNA-binding PadR family transcriptional regulator
MTSQAVRLEVPGSGEGRFAVGFRDEPCRPRWYALSCEERSSWHWTRSALYIRYGYMNPVNAKKALEPTPLTPAVFHILLALADGRKHGYAIMKQVEADSGGPLPMGPGTLYGSLRRMSAAGLVEELEELDDERRRYYRLTGTGERALTSELTRLRRALTMAKRKGVPASARAAE